MRRGRSADTSLNSSGLHPPHATAASLAPARLTPAADQLTANLRSIGAMAGGTAPFVSLRRPATFQHNAAVAQASVAKPLLSTTTSRSTTRARNETRVFSGQISVRIV